MNLEGERVEGYILLKMLLKRGNDRSRAMRYLKNLIQICIPKKIRVSLVATKPCTLNIPGERISCGKRG